jgi:hypothetical protein
VSGRWRHSSEISYKSPAERRLRGAIRSSGCLERNWASCPKRTWSGEADKGTNDENRRPSIRTAALCTTQGFSTRLRLRYRSIYEFGSTRSSARFALITHQAIGRGSFRSVCEMVRQIGQLLLTHQTSMVRSHSDWCLSLSNSNRPGALDSRFAHDSCTRSIHSPSNTRPSPLARSSSCAERISSP